MKSLEIRNIKKYKKELNRYFEVENEKKIIVC